MSDLQCPARLFVARHGEATYGPHARGLLTNAPGELTGKGRLQARALAELVRSERVSAVFSSPMRRAQETADIVARALDVPCETHVGLQEYGVGDFSGVPYADERFRRLYDAWLTGDLAKGFPNGESGQQLVDRFREALADIADRFRGESVVVISHGGVMSVALPAISRNLRPDISRGQYIPNATPARVDVDAHGFEVITWPGVVDETP